MFTSSGVVMPVLRSKKMQWLKYRRGKKKLTNSQWARIIQSSDESIGPFACPFALSLAPLTRGKGNDWRAICSVFFSIQAHSERVESGQTRWGEHDGG